MKITWLYALNLSMLPASARGIGWEYEETCLLWWGLRMHLRRN